MIRPLLCLAALALGGCQTLPQPAGNSPDALHSWDLSGRLGYRAGSDGGSASIDWQQRDQQGTLHFSGPLGIGSARILWQPGYAELDNGKEKLVSTGSAELAWRLTGLMLPVEALQYWVRGLPSPGLPAEPQFDELGQLNQLEQAGWSLQFDRYAPVDGLQLPFRIRAHSGDDQRFTLIIKDWQPKP